MRFLIVAWTAFSCPGGPLAGFIPAPVRPLLCQARPEHQIYARESDAYRKIEQLGPGVESVLTEYNGLRRKDRRVKWGSYLEIER